MFFAQTTAWSSLGRALVTDLLENFGPFGLSSQQVSLVLVAPGPFGAEGFTHRGDLACYPCSLVKPFHMIHALMAQDAGRLAPDADFDRALRDMILWSSNTATNYIIDLLTGTTGDTILSGAEYLDWASKRDRLNHVFWQFGWPEWEGANISQKLMGDLRYGREAQYAGPQGENLNSLTALAAARLMWELFDGDLPLSPDQLHRAQSLMARDPLSPKAAFPDYQLSEYLGGNLPTAVQIWSKAGHNGWTNDPKTSWFKHDMIRISAQGSRPLTIVLMTSGQALAQTHPTAFPQIGRFIWDRLSPSLKV